ncbi:MAG: PAS domain S-box protein [Candidatus Lokiarchaeota archaeon]|nr:PAS domain S-box protein [Candidatus Lokiarchaeota archaeon]
MTKVESAQERLEETEDKYKKLIESLPHGLSIIQHNKIVFVNKATLEMFGYSDYDEIIGKKATIPLFNKEKEKIYEKGLKLLNKEINGPLHYETLAVRKDGSLFPVETFVSRINYEGWRALQIVMMDISGRVDLEKNYKRILDSIADPINVLDKDLRYIYVNESLINWVRELGYDDELIGKKITEVFEFLPEGMVEEYKHVFDTGETIITHNTSQVDGNTIYTETRKIPIIENNEVTKVLTLVRDITERKLYEKKITESEEKYRHLFENSPLYIMLIDEDWKIIDLNKSTEEMLEYSKEELIGRSISDIPLVPSENEDILRARARETLEGENLSARELQLKTKSGKFIWLKLKPSLIKIKDKKYIHLIGQDITKLKEREKILKINQFAIDHNLIEVYWINPQGRFEYVNHVVCTKLGYEYEKLIGMSVPEVDPMFDQERFQDAWNTIKKNKTHLFETKHITKDGEIYPVKVSGNYFKDKGTELIIAFSFDISDQKKAKERLRYSEEKYRALFENAPYSIYLINMEGKVEDCNKATVDLFGYSKNEFIGSSHQDLNIHPEHKINLFIKRFIKLIKGELVDPLETQLYTKEKKLIWVYIRSFLIKVDNKYLIQTIIQDIDKRKKAEVELKRLNRMKSDLLRRTSHELKTPLVSIKGFTNLLLELYRNDLNTEILSIIDEIKNGCSRLEDLIKDIIKTSELESGHVNFEKSDTDLGNLVKNSVEELRGFIKLRKHIVKVDLDSNLIVYCEKKRIRDVVNNLLSNAVKYTPPEGTIEINSKINEQFVIISIKDSGIGLTEDEIDSIFTQFGKIERYGQGYDVISEGSGLGLYVSKKIIEMHNGKIWVESEGRNKGSTFYFSLPR